MDGASARESQVCSRKHPTLLSLGRCVVAPLSVAGGDVSAKVLTDGAWTALRQKFWHLRPFRNIIGRIDRALRLQNRGPVLLLEEDILVWPHGDLTDNGGADGGTRADRLLILALTDSPASADQEAHLSPLEVDLAQLDSSKVRVVASIDVRYRLRGRAGFQPSSVGPTLLFEQGQLVGTDAYLLSAKMRVFVPVRGIGLFAAQAFPYAQQDAEHHRCIDVSLWTGLNYMSRRLRSRRLTLGALRRVGGVRTSDNLGSAPGLFADEILQVIRSADLAAAQYVAVTPAQRRLGVPGEFVRSQAALHARSKPFLLFLEAMHAYLDSQLPVFLVMARFPFNPAKPKSGRRDRSKRPSPHSVCIMGHVAYDTGTRPNKSVIATFEKHAGFLTATAYLREFIAQDDDVGPLLRLPVWHHDEVAGAAADPERVALWDESLEGNGVAFSVGLPKDIRLAFEGAFSRVSELLDRLAQTPRESDYREGYETALAKFGVDLAIDSLAGAFVHAMDAKQLVVGMYIEHTRRLQQHVLEMPTGPAKTWLLNRNLPRYVWIAEIAIREDVEEGYEDFVVGEVFLDATQPSSPWSVLAYRLPGVFAAFEDEVEYHFTDWPVRKSWVRRNFKR